MNFLTFPFFLYYKEILLLLALLFWMHASFEAYELWKMFQEDKRESQLF